MTTLKQLAETLLKIDADLHTIDASSLEEVIAALRMRQEKGSYKNHSVNLELAIRDSGIEQEWKIWDGSTFHVGDTLQAAYMIWRTKHMTPETVSVDDVAGVLNPATRKKVKEAVEL